MRLPACRRRWPARACSRSPAHARGDDALAAVHLCGAAQALRTTLGVPLPAVEQTDHAQALAALHADQFKAAWRVGQMQPLEQVVAEAGLEAPPA